MDEDHVNRRDAVVGLGLLGVLTLMFVATMFYRIINPSPPDRVSLEGMTIADSLQSAAPLASQPPALPETAPVQRDRAVSAAAFGGEQPTRVDQPQPVPTFVSPSSR